MSQQTLQPTNLLFKDGCLHTQHATYLLWSKPHQISWANIICNLVFQFECPPNQNATCLLPKAHFRFVEYPHHQYATYLLYSYTTFCLPKPSPKLYFHPFHPYQHPRRSVIPIFILDRDIQRQGVWGGDILILDDTTPDWGFPQASFALLLCLKFCNHTCGVNKILPDHEF